MRTLLVANRGEIAARIFRTCRELGIRTVAVTAEDEPNALHGRLADETHLISSYLRIEEHLRVAETSNADAIHPGYGFLSENPDFAAAVLAASLIWIGPPVAALRAGGNKIASKETARGAGVPVVEAGDPETLGYPLLIKAAAGGGGRGMRVVRGPEELDDALESAAREAQGAFGDGTVFYERYIERPRHVEIQLLADMHGTIVTLGERDCSIQRRHQKVLEESPSPALDEQMRREMAASATRFAAAIGYEGAGTAEFMCDGRDFYFLELNARIQVEHPVTEAVTGIDLIAEQIRIARGERLELQPSTTGHAIEVRLYAEHPTSFLPQTGILERLRVPAGIRVDLGVAEGDEIGGAYDPMIAKLIAHGGTRAEAIARLSAALAATEVGGLGTNLPFLRWLVAHPSFLAGETTTAFLIDYPALSPYPIEPPPAWRGPFRLNLPSPERQPPPVIGDSAAQSGAEGSAGLATAPMPGTVIHVDVVAGDAVTARQQLLILEAMKLEVPVLAPADGVVEAVYVALADAVAAGDVLVVLGPVPGSD
jgi:acetyl/propionyl-CoA carboxylase alpha subunit